MNKRRKKKNSEDINTKVGRFYKWALLITHLALQWLHYVPLTFHCFGNPTMAPHIVWHIWCLQMVVLLQPAKRPRLERGAKTGSDNKKATSTAKTQLSKSLLKKVSCLTADVLSIDMNHCLDFHLYWNIHFIMSCLYLFRYLLEETVNTKTIKSFNLQRCTSKDEMSIQAQNLWFYI